MAGSNLTGRGVAEFTGTTMLLAAIVGSGIMGERLAGGNAGIALLANSLATGAALVAIILALGPVSGAHLNPAVTIAVAWKEGLPRRDVPVYLLAQIGGAATGVALANLMFTEPLFSVATESRAGAGLWLSEAIATFGLLTVIWGTARTRSTSVAFAVGAYITAAYWFTSSTSFANPAVTIARSLTNTFTGIAPASVPAFIAAQFIGAFAATTLFTWLAGPLERAATDVVQPHEALAAEKGRG